MTTSPRVIIVGAGAAGIAAATRLFENGISDITILEAEDRIGGRINSVEFCGKIVDLGGQWCHGEKGNVVYEMVKDLNLLAPSHNTYQDNTYYLSDGTVLDKELTDELFILGGTVLEDEECARKYPGSFGDYFVKEYMKRVKSEFKSDEKAQKVASILVDWFHKFFNCLESTKTWFDVSNTQPFHYKGCEGDLQWNWKDKGFKTILDVLMKNIPDGSKRLQIDDKIFLKKEVTKIVWDSDKTSGVTVECGDQSSYNADHVILTVSLGVLKKFQGNMFVPELPPFKQKAIEAMEIGTVNKILLKFPTKWWGDDLKGFSLVWTAEDRENLIKEFPHGPSENGKSWLEDVYGFYVIDSHPQVLLGWVVGSMADQVELLSDEVAIEGCMHLLKKFLDDKFKIEEPEAVLRSVWKNNPHFLGSYSYLSKRAEQENISGSDLAQPLVSSSNKQCVLFAGEATHPHYYSTVHGAIETGHREADRLLRIYNPKSLFHKVAVIGAGMAGLGAAAALLEKGFDDFVIIEADDEPGGRIRTLMVDGHVLDLGAQWIHGQDNPLFRLADKHGLVSPQTSEEGLGLYLRENGEIVDDFLVKLVDFQVGRILGECESFVNSPNHPQSVGDFLLAKFDKYLAECGDCAEIREVKKELLDWHIRFQIIDNSCLDLHRLSAKAWGSYSCDEEEKTHINLRRGYGELVAILVENLPENSLLLSSPVHEIKCGAKSSEPLTIICTNGRVITCDHVVFTASVGVLKSGWVLIDPPLMPYEISQSIDDMGFHAIGKIFLIFDYKWWGDVKGFQLIFRRNSSPLTDEEAWTRYITGFDPVPNEPNILLGWVGGAGVAAMEGLSEEDVGRHCMNLIRRFVRGREIPDPVKVVRTKWFSNPWVRGSYCHITPECDRSDSGIDKLSRPVFVDSKLRILLAGEAIHTSHFSTTHGAYESGYRQAELLFEYINNKTASKL